jgi:hypothetical protein
VSFRDISTVVMINRRTGAIYWKLGGPPLSGQHAPHILSNGNLLLFDNGPHRLDHSFPFSRVLEIDPATKEIVWKYQEVRVSDFFSPTDAHAAKNVGTINATNGATRMGWDDLWSHEYAGRKHSAAKCALNLQIRREEFTACLRSALRATCQTHCKRTMKLMTEGRS